MHFNNRFMKKVCASILFGCTVLLFVSCGRDFPPNVDTRSNVYKQLSIANNGEVDSLVKRVESFKEITENNNPIKILQTSDEMAVITALINASIDGELNVDSLGMTSKNTFFLSSNDNIGNVDFKIKDSIFESEGYYGEFRKNITNYEFTDASKIWRTASNNYEAYDKYAYRDSITEEEKKAIELKYADDLQVLKNLKYIVFEEDALLIPPIVEKEKKGFISGYAITYLYAYNIHTLEKVGQRMVVSSNSDEISYTSLSGGTLAQYEGDMIIGQLRMNLIMQKAKNIDSLFTEDYKK